MKRKKKKKNKKETKKRKKKKKKKTLSEYNSTTFRICCLNIFDIHIWFGYAIYKTMMDPCCYIERILI